MKNFITIGLLALTLPVFGQVTWREATPAEMAAGTAGTPVAVTPRRLAGAGLSSNAVVYTMLVTNIYSTPNTNVLYATLAGSTTYNGRYDLAVGGMPASYNAYYSDPGAITYTNLATGHMVMYANPDFDNWIGYGMVPVTCDPQVDSDFYNPLIGSIQAPVQWIISSGTNAAPAPYVTFGTNYVTNIATIYAPNYQGLSLTNQNTLWISPSGNDTNAIVGNPAFPFKTLYHASQVAPDFSTFIIQPGEYDESFHTIVLKNAKVYAYGAIIDYFENDPYGTSTGVPINGIGSFEWWGGTINKTTIGEATIGYGYVNTSSDATNLFRVRDVTFNSPNSGGIQGGFFNKSPDPFTFDIENNTFNCSWYAVELDGGSAGTYTNHTDYVLNNVINETDGPLSSAAHQCIFFVNDILRGYVSGNTIQIVTTLNAGAGISALASKSKNIYVSGNLIDISHGVNCLTLDGATNMVVYGHPYAPESIKSGPPLYIGNTIQAGHTNVTSATSVVIKFGTPMSSTNYTALCTDNGAALAGYFPSFKTTNNFTANFTSLTASDIDWTVILQTQ